MGKANRNKQRVKREEKRKRLKLQRRLAPSGSEDRFSSFPDPVLAEIGKSFDLLLAGEPIPSLVRRDYERILKLSHISMVQALLDLDNFLFHDGSWSLPIQQVRELQQRFSKWLSASASEALMSLSLLCEPAVSDFETLSSTWPFTPENPSFLGQGIPVLSETLRLPFMLLAFTHFHGIKAERLRLLKTTMKAIHSLDLGSNCQEEFFTHVQRILTLEMPSPLISADVFGEFEQFLAVHHGCLEENPGYEGLRLFLQQYFLRQLSPEFISYGTWSRYPGIIEHVWGVDSFRLSLDNGGLKAANFSRDRLRWQHFLKEEVSYRDLDFEDSLRHKLALLRVSLNLCRVADSSNAHRDLEKIMLELIQWLRRGVPSHAQEMAKKLLPQVVEYYLDELRWDDTLNFHREPLRRLHQVFPSDYRLSILRFMLSKQDRQWLKSLDSSLRGNSFGKIESVAFFYGLWATSDGERANFSRLFFQSLSNEQRREVVVRGMQNIIHQVLPISEKKERWDLLFRYCVKDDAWIQEGIKSGMPFESELLFIVHLDRESPGFTSLDTFKTVGRWIQNVQAHDSFFSSMKEDFIQQHLKFLFEPQNVEKGALDVLQSLGDGDLFRRIETQLRWSFKSVASNSVIRKPVIEFASWLAKQHISKPFRKFLEGVVAVEHGQRTGVIQKVFSFIQQVGNEKI